MIFIVTTKLIVLMSSTRLFPWTSPITKFDLLTFMAFNRLWLFSTSAFNFYFFLTPGTFIWVAFNFTGMNNIIMYMQDIFTRWNGIKAACSYEFIFEKKFFHLWPNWISTKCRSVFNVFNLLNLIMNKILMFFLLLIFFL